ncbi:unnamed protein product, partial [Staurois parvus]
MISVDVASEEFQLPALLSSHAVTDHMIEPVSSALYSDR